MKKIVLMLMLLTPVAASAQKFGHVDMQSIIASLPEYIKAEGELKALAAQYENDLKAMGDEIQRKADNYEKTQSTMNATKKQETETELQQLQQKFQQAYSDNQQALQKAQNEKLGPIQTKVLNAIQNVGKAGNYVYIMQTNSLPYISTTLSKDITAEVKAELNKLK